MATPPTTPAKPAKLPAAGHDPAQESLFREVDEDLRQEKLEAFWKRWGSAIIAACVALVLGVAGWEVYAGWQQSEAEEASARYTAATSYQDPVQRTQALGALVEEGPPGYRMIAALQQGAAAAAQGDLATATAAYQDVAASVDDPLYDDLAVLLSVIAEMREPGSGSPGGDSAALAAQLEPLTAAGRPWRYSALELSAHLALQTGEDERAKEIFQSLANDAQAPQTIQARAYNFERFLASR